MPTARSTAHRIALLVALPALALIVAAPARGDDKDAAKKKATLASFTLRDDLPEGASSPGLFGEMSSHLRDVIDKLDKAAKDDKLSGIVLELRGPGIGLGKVAELRSAIGRVRQAGKKVYADVDSATTRDYLVASACDEIIMPPSGDLMITGVRAEVMFYKGLLDKVGVEASFIQIGDFKGASEPLTRKSMSPEFHKQLESVIDDYYQQIIESIAQDRKLEPQKVKDLIDEGLFTAQQAKDAKLIDRVAYRDELNDQLKTELKADEVAFDREYGKKKIDTDFSGFSGFLKLMEVVMGGGEGKEKKSAAPKIAVIYAVGTIMTGESVSTPFGEDTVGSDSLVKALRQAKNDDTVKAIVLRVDSPGGSALASDLIWREIVQAKKPVIASMGDVAASGGYYISMGAKKIFAEPGTLTGSIGVVGGKMALKGLFDKLGLTTETISRGKNSGSLSSTEPFSPSEREAWKKTMTEIYRQFTTKAAEGRKMDLAKLQDLAQGKVYSGRMAVANGLVDKIGTLTDAIAEAKSMAGVNADEKLDLLILPKPKSFLEQLFEGPSLESEAKILAPEMVKALRSAGILRQLFAKPAVVILPYRVEIK